MPKRPREASKDAGEGLPIPADKEVPEFPSFQLLDRVVTFYDKFRSLEGSTRTIKDVAENAQDRQNFYKDIRRLEAILGYSLFTKVPGYGTQTTFEQEQILNQIIGIVDRVRKLRKGERTSTKLKIATSHLLSVRVVRPIIDAFLREESRDNAPGVEVAITLKSPMELASMAEHDHDHDFIITFASSDWDFQKKRNFGTPVDVHRCILARRDHPFVRHRGDIEKDGTFDFAWLRGLKVAMLIDSQRVPDFQSMEVTRHAEILVTHSTLESHAHVRAGTADIAFTHKEILSEFDIKHLVSIDLTSVHNAMLKHTQLWLFPGDRRLAGDATAIRNRLRESLQRYLSNVSTRYQSSNEKTGMFSAKFTRISLWEHGDSGSGGPPARPAGGSVELEVNVPYVTEVGEEFYYVSGRYMDGETNATLPIFGRVWTLDSTASAPYAGRTHLWNGTLSQTDICTFSLTFGESDLDGDHLVGEWIGVAPWIQGSKRASSGVVVFHKRPDIGHDTLHEWLTEHKARRARTAEAILGNRRRRTR